MSGGYATAVYEDMTTAQLESLEDDLFRFARIVGATPALRAALTDRDLDVTARQGLVTQLLEGKVPPTTLALTRFAVTGGRARDVVGTLVFLVERTAQARGWRIAARRRRGPDRGRAANRAGRLARQPGRRHRWSCRWRSTRRC